MRKPLFVLVLVGTLLLAASAFAQTMKVPLAGSAVPQASSPGGDSITSDEFNVALMSDADSGNDATAGVNRTIARKFGAGRSINAGPKPKSNPSMLQSFEGLNFHDQRFANQGNQFSIEPPDQALCVGNGFVVEAVNDVFKVFSTSGHTLLSTVDMNTFLGYVPAIDRAHGNRRGPSVTDPQCRFDPDTGQFFLSVLTLEVVASGSNAGRQTGPNHLDLAVTSNGDPTGSWNIYKIPVQNDGTQGTPDHHCPPRRPPVPSYITNPRACLGDYPEMGFDSNGLYITTNEFGVFGGFFGSQIYAFSKRALARGDASVNVVLLNTLDIQTNDPTWEGGGFTVWPAIAPYGGSSNGLGGTEYFVSSTAVFQDSGFDTKIRIYALTNTSSLDTDTPSMHLMQAPVPVGGYGVPGFANQKTGVAPLGMCVADPACWFLVGLQSGPINFGNPPLNSNDSRVQQVFFANGKLWVALDTGLIINGTDLESGIAYYLLTPQVSANSVKAKVAIEGLIGLENNSLTYPSIAALTNGRGVMSFTLVGQDYHPSVGFVSLDPVFGAGDVQVAMNGAAPQDGFTEYSPGPGQPGFRPRWGDYGSAATDGTTIWFAQEYVATACTYAQYLASPFGQCGGTRGSLGNWSTGIVQVAP